MRCILRLNRYEVWFDHNRAKFCFKIIENPNDFEKRAKYYLRSWFRTWLTSNNVKWEWDSTYGILSVDNEGDAVLIVLFWA